MAFESMRPDGVSIAAFVVASRRIFFAVAARQGVGRRSLRRGLFELLHNKVKSVSKNCKGQSCEHA
jgi:membrane protease YdiL (CAAX protease family)